MPFRPSGGITKTEAQELIAKAEERALPLFAAMLDAIKAISADHTRAMRTVDDRLGRMEGHLERIEELLRNGR